MVLCMVKTARLKRMTNSVDSGNRAFENKSIEMGKILMKYKERELQLYRKDLQVSNTKLG